METRKKSTHSKSEKIRQAEAEWKKRLRQTEEKSPPRPTKFTTVSDLEVPLLSTPADL